METVVRTIMSADLAAVVPGTEVGEAERLCARRGIRHLLVMRAGDLLGVLCTCDLERGASATAVERVMAAPVATIGPDASLSEAAARMRRGQFGCLPVVERGEIVGIVTRHDLEDAGYRVERRRCTTCGSRHHLRRDVARGSSSFCVDCLAHAAEAADASGEGGEEE